MKRRRTKRKASDGETKQVKKRFEVGEEAICETPEIGKDLMFEVLTRLPIKSLLRFKAVSKYWFRLISSSEFIKFRLRNACEDPDLSDHRVVYIKRSDSEVALRQIPLHPLVCANGAYFMFEINVSHPMEINASHPMEFWEEEARRFALTFVGSCSGLVCIAGLNHRLIVWNPALRKCKRLPYFGRGSPVSYGFGYDEASDDFKVVGIRNTPKTLVKIYSARTNSWKKLQEDDFVVDRVEGRGCLLNGKLHWATKKDMIFTVDLSSERFGAMEPPDCVRGRDCTGWSVHAAGTSLAVFCFHRNRPPMMYVADLWMMDQYGAKESWNRVNNDITDRRHMGWAVFKERAVLLHSLYVAPSRPRGVWQLIPAPGHMTDNDIIAFLLHSVKQYSFYDPPYFFMAFGIGQEYPVTVYVESLTWPYL